MADGTSYVYMYMDVTGQPLYIGKGTGRRDVMHRFKSVATGDTSYWHRKMLKMDRLGEAYTVERVAEGLTHEEACEMERALIAKHGRRSIDDGGILYNLLSGGDGASPEDMQRMYEDPEFRARQAEGARRTAQDPLWRANVIAASELAMAHPDAMDRLARAREIRWSAEGAGEHHSEKMLEWYADPENKKRQADAIREKRAADPEFDRRQREATREKWKDPEFRARKAESNRESWKKPGRKEKHSEISRKKWQDPEYRARVMDARRVAAERRKINQGAA